METTGQQIFKRLSGQVANVGSVIGGVKHGIDDMKKEADKANANIQVQQQANQNAQSEIESKQFQNAEFQSRLEGVSNPQVEQPQVETTGGKQ